MAELKVLMVDDDEMNIELLAPYLKKAGVEMLTASKVKDALKLCKNEEPDCVVAHTTMTGSGLVEMLMKTEHIPAIVFGAKDTWRAGDIDRGSMNYLSTPFEMPRLLSQINLALHATAEPPRPTVLHYHTNGNLTIDSEKREVVLDGKKIPFGKKEFDLLWVLASNPNIIFSREQLIEQVWGEDAEMGAGNVAPYIGRFRTKLGDVVVDHPKFIDTIRGIGYLFIKDKS